MIKALRKDSKSFLQNLPALPMIEDSLAGQKVSRKWFSNIRFFAGLFFLN